MDASPARWTGVEAGHKARTHPLAGRWIGRDRMRIRRVVGQGEQAEGGSHDGRRAREACTTHHEGDGRDGGQIAGV